MVIPASTGLYIQVTTFGVGKAILVDFVYPLPGVNRLHSSHVRIAKLATNVSHAVATSVDLPALPDSFCKK